MKRVSIGAIVHFFDRAAAPWEPNKVGPYAAIVTWVHSDGETVDCEVFPTRDSSPGGTAYTIPHGLERADGQRPYRRRWWQWPDAGEVDKG